MARRGAGGIVYVFAQHLSLLSCLFTFVGVFDFGYAAALLRCTSREAAGSIRLKREKKEKGALFPNHLLPRLRELERQGADPGSTHILFHVRCLSLYMQMAQRSQISFEVI